MADAAASDRDLASIHEARTLARRAKQAQSILAEYSQEQIDGIVDAMAAAATRHAEASARAAVEETAARQEPWLFAFRGGKRLRGEPDRGQRSDQ